MLDIEASADQSAAVNAAMRVKQMLAGFISRLERDVEDRVAKRAHVERRWLSDLRLLHGQYEPGKAEEWRKAHRCALFFNVTRPKTNACEARLFDMLFPTDDKNWSIGPTPSPEMESQLKAARAAHSTHKDLADVAASEGKADLAQHASGIAGLAAKMEQELEATRAEAAKRARAMETEINDQLVESGYAAQMRDVIRDACRLGSGVVKGPIARADRTRRAWQEQPGQGYSLAWQEQPRPAFVRVDPWHFFPDPSAARPSDSESFAERHLMTRKELRALAGQPGFDAEAIRRVLRTEPTASPPSYMADLRSMGTGEQSGGEASKRYLVWEYRGPLSPEDASGICACVGRAEDAEGLDPLAEVQVCVWFCEGELLRFGFHHLESEEPIYSVFNLEQDEASPWGYGIPHLMRNEQEALNGAWRMLIDNAALTVSPQFVFDQAVLDPVNDDWTLKPGKAWLRRSDAVGNSPGIYTIDVPNHQDRLAQIIQLARTMVDDVTSISDLAQGDQASTTTQTFGGMALLLNSKNVVFRRFVRNFDDDITVPCILRMYDWNMQFTDKPWIRGDYEVEARGASTLLVREVQATNRMVLATLTAHPVLGQFLKPAQLLRSLAASMMIPADDIILSDEDIQRAAEEQQQQNGQGQQDPKLAIEQFKAQAQQQFLQADMQMRQQLAQLDGANKLKLAEIDRETALIKLAQDRELKIEDLKAKLHINQVQVDHSERAMAAEMGFKDAQSKREAVSAQAGRAVDLPNGTRFAG
jgi:hypothetical protein